MTDLPPEGDVHLVLSPTMDTADHERLERWLNTHGLQMVALGQTEHGDLRCMLLPVSLPEPATASGVPEPLPEEIEAESVAQAQVRRCEALLRVWRSEGGRDPYYARALRVALYGPAEGEPDRLGNPRRTRA